MSELISVSDRIYTKLEMNNPGEATNTGRPGASSSMP